MEYIRSEVNSLGALNAELEKIEVALDSKLSTEATGPRVMTADLDMNSNQVLNLPVPSSPTDPVRLGDLPELLGEIQGANYVGVTPPASVFNGLRWFNPSVPTTYVYYVDGDSGQWVEETAQGVDGKLRQDLAAVDSIVPIGGQQAGIIASLVQQLNARTKAGMVYGDNTSYRYRVISAVIRNTGSGWFIINDAAHEPTGLQSVSVEPDGTIRLNHNVGATQVGSLVAVPDETFGKMGLVIGGSIGTSISFLQISAPLNFTVNTGTGVITAPSVFGSDITTSVSSGVCTINHPATTTGTAPTAVSVGSATKTDFNVSFGTTQIVIDGVGDIDGYIRWDGSAWQYTGNLRTPPTFAFAGGELTVTHPACDQFNLSLVGREDGLRVGAGAIDGTSFKVRFYDSTGAQVTTVSTLMKFYVTRRARALKNALSGSVSIQAGYAPVDANNVVSTTGNIWIYGLMVV